MNLQQQNSRPNFLAVLSGLLLAPRETTEMLLQQKDPPFAATILLCLLLSVWVPAASQSHKYGYNLFETYALFRFTFIFGSAFLLFLFLETLLLLAFRIQSSLRLTFACAAYSWAPLILWIWIIHVVNFVVSGHLTLLTILILGYGSVSPPFSIFLPWAMIISTLLVARVFAYTLQALAGYQIVSALIATFFSLLPLALAVLIGMLASEIIWPGTIRMIHEIIAASPWSLFSDVPP
jgi:hypothetical protein